MRKTCLLLLAAVVMTLVGCAKMGQPDGGWYDETPPHVIGSNPKDQSTNVHTRKVNIYFDEYIKLENATEKVVISPPQLEAPEIKDGGNRIVVTINDTLVPNTTYTIDFSDAITDNNEGNPLGNYTYSFSTGEVIDTMQVAGFVVEAENMEPIKGILVGLYDNLNDTAFTTQPMLRVARTDSRGYFIIKGVAPGNYRAYALEDADGNYKFSQKSEKIAFSHDIFVPSCKPDVRQDTIWQDSLHIASISQTGYTHFLPDDIVLRAFNETLTDRMLVKTERKEPTCLSFFFSYGNPQPPQLRGLNFDETDAFVLESSEHLDTLNYWLRDTTLVNQDTLRIEMTYLATDSTGVLKNKIDTLDLLAKTSYEKRMKELEKEREKWEKKQEKAKKKGKKYETEMPVKPLEIKIQVRGDMMPDSYFYLESPTPLAIADTSKIRLVSKVDTLTFEKKYILTERTIEADSLIPPARRFYVLRPDSIGNLWTPGTSYTLELDSAAFVDIYGLACKAEKKGISIKKKEEYTTVTFHVAKQEEAPYIGQLMDKSDKVVSEVISETGDLTFPYVKPGEYYFRVIADANRNGKWDTGEYDDDRQAETVNYYPEKIECKERWAWEKSWNPANVSPFRLKPSEITKQKPDKEKKLKNRNIERARQLGIQYIPKNH